VAQCVLEPGEVELHGVFLQETAPARLGDDCGHAHCGGSARRRSRDRRLRRRGANDVRQPERDGERPRLLLDRGLVVERERLERLDQVSSVQVEERVARHDQLVEDGPRERVAIRAVEGPGEAAVEVLPVIRGDERSAGLEGREVHDRNRGDRPSQLSRLEPGHEAHDGRDRAVFAAVDPGDEREPRSLLVTDRDDARKLEARQELGLEAERAALDHDAILQRIGRRTVR
jgi:hypothetical protein